jgi:hypothetical protein
MIAILQLGASRIPMVTGQKEKAHLFDYFAKSATTTLKPMTHFWGFDKLQIFSYLTASLLLICLGYSIYRLSKKCYANFCFRQNCTIPKTLLTLQICGGGVCLILQIAEFVGTPIDFTIVCKELCDAFVVNGSLKPFLSFRWKAQVIDKFTGAILPVPQTIGLRWGEANKLRRILLGEFTAKPMFQSGLQVFTASIEGSPKDVIPFI